MPALGTSLTRLARTLFTRPGPAPDGLPFPPARLIHAVAGTPDTAWFWQGGRLGAQTLVDILARRGRTLSEFSDILDFGCGCGRVLRHLSALAPGARLHGTDYNPALIRWCARHLPVVTVSTNALAPPTGHAAGSFDLIYAFSVLTHLTEPLQHAWMAELHRLLRPGGCLIVSTHGERYLEKLTGADRENFTAGRLVVWSGDRAGENRCAAFHPPTWLRDHLAPTHAFTVLEHLPEGALGNPHQDAWLLERRP